MKTNWLRAAMTDDNLVAELLLRLHRPDSRRAQMSRPPLPLLDWGIRQPRSKAAATSLKKEHESSRRRSPTTPLSWTASGAASPTDSREESSRPLVLAARFKGCATTDASANKRSRRKRTIAELKETETSLLKQREHLNKQIESLHMKLEEQRLFNESLKRIKVIKALETEREASTSKAPSKIKFEEISIVEQQPQIFVLPDLNMTPSAYLK